MSSLKRRLDRSEAHLQADQPTQERDYRVSPRAVETIRRGQETGHLTLTPELEQEVRALEVLYGHRPSRAGNAETLAKIRDRYEAGHQPLTPQLMDDLFRLEAS